MDTYNNQNQIMDSDRVHHFLVIEDPSFVREIELDAATYSIGRHSSNDIVLSCQKTSRNHATLLRRTDVKTNQCSYWILDGDLQGNRSRNGIYVNGKKSLVHELSSGDLVHFSGDASIRYKNTSAPQVTGADVDGDINININADSDLGYSSFAQPSAGFKETSYSSLDKETYVAVEPQPIHKNNSRSLNVSEQNSLAELSPHPIFEIDLYGNITYINTAGIISFKDLHHRKLNHPLLADLITQYQQGANSVIDREVVIDGLTFEQTAHYLPERRAIRNYITDISQQKQIEERLRQAKAYADRLVSQVQEGILLVESATKQIVEANSSCTEILGYSRDELLQMNIYELVGESEKFSLVLRTLIAEKNDFAGEYLLRHKNGSSLEMKINLDTVESDGADKICLVIQRLTPGSSAEIISQQSIRELKQNLFQQQLLTAIANAKRSQKLLSVMICHLNFTPDIAASIGEKNYELLHSALEKRLSSSLRSGDTVVRWQENQFAILLPQVNDLEEITKIQQRIGQSIDRPFNLGKVQTSIDSVMGIAVYPQDGNDPEILLASANTALDMATNNRSNYQFYDEAMNSQALVALELESLLERALEREEFELYYQPQININSGKVEAIEALLRWQHQELGLVPPGNFIRLAEKTKLIVPIGEWTIRTACSQNKQWQNPELPPSKITVSLSLVQFQQPNLAQKIAEILSETDFDAYLLELEISAATLMDNVEHSKRSLDQLKALGINIAVDGFATGFLGLEYLKQLPFDTLKIDRSSIQQLTDSPQDLAIVTALIELAKGFNLRVVAEGVETQEQVELLRSLNCFSMQGYWFGRPLAAKEASKLLQLNDSDEAMASLQDTEVLTSDGDPAAVEPESSSPESAGSEVSEEE